MQLQSEHLADPRACRVQHPDERAVANGADALTGDRVDEPTDLLGVVRCFFESSSDVVFVFAHDVPLPSVSFMSLTNS